jgi:hypothetical protein
MNGLEEIAEVWNKDVDSSLCSEDSEVNTSDAVQSENGRV